MKANTSWRQPRPHAHAFQAPPLNPGTGVPVDSPAPGWNESRSRPVPTRTPPMTSASPLWRAWSRVWTSAGCWTAAWRWTAPAYWCGPRRGQWPTSWTVRAHLNARQTRVRNGTTEVSTEQGLPCGLLCDTVPSLEQHALDVTVFRDDSIVTIQ